MRPSGRLARWWRIGLLGLLAASVLSLLGTRIRWLSLAAHFQVYAACAWGVALLALLALPQARAAWLRPGRIAAAGALCGLAHAVLIARLWLPEAAPEPPPGGAVSAQPLHAVWFNMQHNEAALAEVERSLLADPPDVLALGEMNAETAPRLLPGLQHALSSAPAEIGVWARWPARNVRAHPVAGDRDQLELTLEAGGSSLTLLVAHWRVPLRGSHYEAARSLAALAAQRPQLLVLGDLNATPWAPELRLLEASGLREARRGRGIICTWAFDPWHLLTLPIDYALAKGTVRIAAFEALPWTASDHRPVRVRAEF